MRKNISRTFKKLDNNKPMKNNIVFSSEPKNVAYAEKLIDQISEELDISSDVYGNILVSVVEAVNNAINHGNKQDRSKKVSLFWDYENQQLSFKIIDEGPGFDFTKTPDPTAPENLEKPNGRGIFLMKHLADEVEFNEKGNQVELRFEL